MVSAVLTTTAERRDGTASGPGQPGTDQLWAWLAEVPDPEIPVLSIVDLGIVRGVAWSEDDGGLARITVTPTYSGCPATEAIARQIREELLGHGVRCVELKVEISPPWTTDRLTDRAKEKLREYGIAPPTQRAGKGGDTLASILVVLESEPQQRLEPPCPRCGSDRTEMLSRFGSTPCKSLHRCRDCQEPFDHFKCH